jgi:hypothetical protein
MKLPIQTLPIQRDISYATVTRERVIPAAYKGPCYFHHNCPTDGLYQGSYTKRQCKDGGGYSWMNKRGGCENLR